MDPLETKNTLKKAKLQDSILLSLFMNSDIICSTAQASFYGIDLSSIFKERSIDPKASESINYSFVTIDHTRRMHF